MTCTKCDEREAKRLLIFALGKSLADQPDPVPRCNPCTAEDVREKVGDNAAAAGATYSLDPADGARMLNDWYLQGLLQPIMKAAACA
jgi:hypothetical protein